MVRRWAKLEKDFLNKSGVFDISKIPDIYDCIKYDLLHNINILQLEQAEELYTYAKNLADVVIPQVSCDFVHDIVADTVVDDTFVVVVDDIVMPLLMMVMVMLLLLLMLLLWIALLCCRKRYVQSRLLVIKEIK